MRGTYDLALDDINGLTRLRLRERHCPAASNASTQTSSSYLPSSPINQVAVVVGLAAYCTVAAGAQSTPYQSI
jgi:hypothetical protein